jgi:Tol biopolymer transport system component
MRGLTAFSSSIALIAFAHGAHAQSLSRSTMRPGGVENFESPAVIEVSPDGYLLVSTAFDGLVPGDNNGFVDLVVTDRRSGTTSMALTGVGGAALDGDSSLARFSFNGRWLCITTYASNLGALDTNANTDVYVKDLVTGNVVRASLGEGGVEPDLGADTGSVSDDGRFLAFASYSNNITSNAGSPHFEIYVRDLWNASVELVSVNLSGEFSDDVSNMPSISADGRYVAFLSQAPDLVPGDTNHFQDVFVRDRRLQTTTRVNVGPGGVEANADVYYDMHISSNGRVIAFDSNATNLLGPGGPPNFLEVYVLDRNSGVISLASAGIGGAASDSDSFGPRISANGRYVSFQSWASNMSPADQSGLPDLFRYDRVSGSVELVSRATNGAQGVASPVFGFEMGFGPISKEGDLIAFSTNLAGLVAGDSNEHGDVFVWDSSSSAGPIDSYCTAKLDSHGCVPVITCAGEPRLSGPTDAFFLSASNLRNRTAGLLAWSLAGPAAQPFAGGVLCIANPRELTPPASSGGSTAGDDCTGTQSFHLTQGFMASHGITPGSTVCAQFWNRDPGFAPPDNVGLSDAIRFTATP